MYCSTCGALLAPGRSRCDSCGTAVYSLDHSPERTRWVERQTSAICPRCGYQGEGVGYFNRGSHLAAIVGITLLTAGMMGAGGAIYYLVRREHVVCPRCGHGWGKHGYAA